MDMDTYILRYILRILHLVSTKPQSIPRYEKGCVIIIPIIPGIQPNLRCKRYFMSWYKRYRYMEMLSSRLDR